jgi:hypothetical protein
MKRWKIFLLILSFVLICVVGIIISPTQKLFKQDHQKIKSDFKADSEPAGFRGTPWLINLSHLPNMEELTDHPDNRDPYKLYTNTKEKNIEGRQIVGAYVEKIDYWSMHDKFVKVAISFRGKENWNILKKNIFERFGDGRIILREKATTKSSYLWMGKNVSMHLRFGSSPN